MRMSPDSPCCLQELADAKVTHNIDGFVHKAFSVAFGTSFDEVRRTNRNLSGTEGCMARMMMMMMSTGQCSHTKAFQFRTWQRTGR